jgi:hypothetical protein
MQVETMTPSKIHEAGPSTPYLYGLVFTAGRMHEENEDLKGHFEKVWCFPDPPPREWITSSEMIK